MKKFLSILLCAVMLAVPLALTAQAETIWPGQTFETAKKPGWVHPLPMRAQYFYRSMVSGGFWTDSFLIMHEGKIVYESYKPGQNAEKPHAMNSVTKSVVSALVGIAIKDGYIGSVQDKVMDYYPEAVIAPGQESKRNMTIEHLLTMTAGLPGDVMENCFTCLDAEDAGLAAFETPQVSAPGEQFIYSSGASMQCLVGIVERATGKNLFAYAQEKLFGPLGMTSVAWLAAADGSSTGGFGISMTSRDMLRFGYLYLNDGMWDGQRILPEGWVEQSKPKEAENKAYGYLFWGSKIDKKLGASYAARGMYGQVICVYPEKDLVVVRTGSGFLGRREPDVVRKYMGE